MNIEILNKITKKFVISVLTLMYTFVAFAQATFAWITLNNDTQLDDTELYVVADSNLYLSLDGKNFYNNISNAELQKVLKSNALSDVTTIDGINFFELDDQEGRNIMVSVDDSKYITFDLWFRTDDPTVQKLYLVDNVGWKYNYQTALDSDIDGTYVISKGVQWKSDVFFAYGENNINKGSTGTYYASDSIRIGVVESNLDEEFGVENKEDLKSLIFDPSGNPALGYGVGTGAYDYAMKKGKTYGLPTEFPNTQYTLSTFKNPYEANTENSLCATFQQVETEDGSYLAYTKVKVSVWLEGWDADCFNAVILDSLLIQLKFKGSGLPF